MQPPSTPQQPPSTPWQPPSTPRQPPSTPRQPPSTPRQPPSTPRQPPSTYVYACMYTCNMHMHICTCIYVHVFGPFYNGLVRVTDQDMHILDSHWFYVPFTLTMYPTSGYM